MADLNDFYSTGGAGMAGARPSQAPAGAGSSGVGGNFGVSGSLSATHIDLWGFLGLLAVAYLILHLE